MTNLLAAVVRQFDLSFTVIAEEAFFHRILSKYALCCVISVKNAFAGNRFAKVAT